jgi:hypothetical protein
MRPASLYGLYVAPRSHILCLFYELQIEGYPHARILPATAGPCTPSPRIALTPPHTQITK